MAKRGHAAPTTDDATETAIARLFASSLDAFLTVRKTIASELRASGDKEGAARVLAVHKPTPTARAINEVARAHGAAVAHLRQAAAAQADAMRKRDPAALRKAMRDVSARHADALALAKAAFASEGRAPNADQLRRMSRTLHAGASATGDVAARFERGRLEKDLEPASDFGFGGGDEGESAPAEKPAKTAETRAAPPRAHAVKPSRGPAPKGRAVNPKVDAAARKEAARARREAEAHAAEERRERERAAREHRARVAEAAHLEKQAKAAETRAARLAAAAEATMRTAEKARAIAEAAAHTAEEARTAADEAHARV